jgi:hypothetical protein
MNSTVESLAADDSTPSPGWARGDLVDSPGRPSMLEVRMNDSPLDEVVSLAIVFSLIGSPWVPFLRVVSGLLCLGLAVALTVLVGRSLIIDEHVHVARAVPVITLIVLLGLLELNWGRRTTGAAR